MLLNRRNHKTYVTPPHLTLLAYPATRWVSFVILISPQPVVNFLTHIYAEWAVFIVLKSSYRKITTCLRFFTFGANHDCCENSIFHYLELSKICQETVLALGSSCFQYICAETIRHSWVVDHRFKNISLTFLH